MENRLGRGLVMSNVGDQRQPRWNVPGSSSRNREYSLFRPGRWGGARHLGQLSTEGRSSHPYVNPRLPCPLFPLHQQASLSLGDLIQQSELTGHWAQRRDSR